MLPYYSGISRCSDISDVPTSRGVLTSLMSQHLAMLFLARCHSRDLGAPLWSSSVSSCDRWPSPSPTFSHYTIGSACCKNISFNKELITLLGNVTWANYVIAIYSNIKDRLRHVRVINTRLCNEATDYTSFHSTPNLDRIGIRVVLEVLDP